MAICSRAFALSLSCLHCVLPRRCLWVTVLFFGSFSADTSNNEPINNRAHNQTVQATDKSSSRKLVTQQKSYRLGSVFPPIINQIIEFVLNCRMITSTEICSYLVSFSLCLRIFLPWQLFCGSRLSFADESANSWYNKALAHCLMLKLYIFWCSPNILHWIDWNVSTSLWEGEPYCQNFNFRASTDYNFVQGAMQLASITIRFSSNLSDLGLIIQESEWQLHLKTHSAPTKVIGSRFFIHRKKDSSLLCWNIAKVSPCLGFSPSCFSHGRQIYNRINSQMFIPELHNLRTLNRNRFFKFYLKKFKSFAVCDLCLQTCSLSSLKLPSSEERKRRKCVYA